MAHASDHDLFVSHPTRQLADLVMWALPKHVEDVKLAQQLQRRWVNRVATEIAEEVSMFL